MRPVELVPLGAPLGLGLLHEFARGHASLLELAGNGLVHRHSWKSARGAAQGRPTEAGDLNLVVVRRSPIARQHAVQLLLVVSAALAWAQRKG
eukprot:9359440-Alexandrium_andersonii.AAC.2